MDNDIKIRLAKLKELAERGATEGERNAARKGMQRIIDKYNLTDINIDWDGLFKYRFKYKSKIEMYLIIQVSRVLAGIERGCCKNNHGINYIGQRGTRHGPTPGGL